MNDSNLKSIFRRYIDSFETINGPEHREYYKWLIAKRFRGVMDEALAAPAEQLSERLYEAKKLTENLIDSYTQPFYGLVKFAEREPETVREMFRALYGGGELRDRVGEFLARSRALRDRYYPESYLYKDDIHSVTGYLFFYDPDRNYIFKATHAQIFADCVGFYDDWGSGDGVRLDVYYRMCDGIAEKIRACPELMEADARRFSSGWGGADGALYSDPEKHILTFDIIYCCSTYGLYNGITFERPGSRERRLILEYREKARVLSKKLDSAREEYMKLERAKEYINEVFGAGKKLRHRRFGEGVITENNGTYLKADFTGQEERQLDTFFCSANGFISPADSGAGDFETSAAILRNENRIMTVLSLAEKELAQYADYLET